MSVTWNQTDAASGTGFSQSCSPTAVVQTAQSRQCTVGGTLGSSSATVGGANFDNGVSGTMVMFEVIVPSGATWGSGNWTVNLNITTATSGVTWVATYVCRANSAVTNQATLGSLTGQTTSVGTTGVKTHTVSQGSNATPSAGDKVHIVLVFSSTVNNKTFAFTPSSTITAAGFVVPITITPSPVAGREVPVAPVVTVNVIVGLSALSTRSVPVNSTVQSNKVVTPSPVAGREVVDSPVIAVASDIRPPPLLESENPVNSVVTGGLTPKIMMVPIFR